MPGFPCGRPPRKKGLRYPTDRPAVEEIVTAMGLAGDTAHGLRTRALVVVLWRAGLRISEALALAESDLDRACGSVLVRRGKRGKRGKRRQVGMDGWAWEQLDPWLHGRVSLRVGAPVCHRRTGTGTAVSPAGARATLRSLSVRAGVRRVSHRTNCDTHAVEIAREPYRSTSSPV